MRELIEKIEAADGYILAAPTNFCLRVKNEKEVKETARRLKEQNISVSGPKQYPEYAPDYFTVYFSDPDGVKLEVTNYRQERRQRHDNRKNIGS